ncbi:MAG: hypothetical protein ACE5NM_04885, partial [Sedimentisphaerales bacterium]
LDTGIQNPESSIEISSSTAYSALQIKSRNGNRHIFGHKEAQISFIDCATRFVHPNLGCGCETRIGRVRRTT